MNPLLLFVIDYIDRHKHPLNAILHIFGVPMVFWGLFELFRLHLVLSAILIFSGYLLQYLGHRAQGNEVGEVILLKKIWRKLSSANKAEPEKAKAEAGQTVAGPERN